MSLGSHRLLARSYRCRHHQPGNHSLQNKSDSKRRGASPASLCPLAVWEPSAPAARCHRPRRCRDSVTTVSRLGSARRGGAGRAGSGRAVAPVGGAERERSEAGGSTREQRPAPSSLPPLLRQLQGAARDHRAFRGGPAQQHRSCRSEGMGHRPRPGSGAVSCSPPASTVRPGLAQEGVPYTLHATG